MFKCEKMEAGSSEELKILHENGGGGEGQFITSKGASKRKTRHKPEWNGMQDKDLTSREKERKI